MNSKFTLHRFRMVKLPQDIQQTLALPEIICTDPEGMPFVEGQAFYAWLIDKNGCQTVTATTYLKSVFQFLTFLWFQDPSLRYTASVSLLRESIEAYLREKLGCVMRPHTEGNLLITHSKIVTHQPASLHLVGYALKARHAGYDYSIVTYPTPT